MAAVKHQLHVILGICELTDIPLIKYFAALSGGVGGGSKKVSNCI